MVKTKKNRSSSSASSLPDVSELKSALRIDRYSLDSEIEQQPSLYYQIAEAAAMSRSLMDSAKDNIDRVEADVDSILRKKYLRKDEKPTEKAIRSEVNLNSKRVEAYKDYLELKRRTEELDQLRESFRQRNYMLRELSALFMSGYYQESSTKGSGHKALEKRAERNANRLSERRRARVKSN